MFHKLLFPRIHRILRYLLQYILLEWRFFNEMVPSQISWHTTDSKKAWGKYIKFPLEMAFWENVQLAGVQVTEKNYALTREGIQLG